ncbi:MAG: UvrD-helicase domain-containing protein [Acidobacteriota bacterium]|nr:UvrD-helicase domain-containing protein [Acidobacteriota bacterium]
MRQLEPEQTAAAFTIDRHISVTAGPGSGKTRVLVERYLHILSERSLFIDQIVAITFTNRAANEMRQRLRARLNEILLTASGDERKRWLGYKRTLDEAVITTIHGFCARLLREFPVEAGVDPQFLLLDEHRAAMLLESVVEEALSHFISSGHVEISRLTLGAGRAKLADALAQLYRDVRGQGLSFRDLGMKTANSHSTEEDHARALVDLSRAMDDFLMFPRTTLAGEGNQAEVSTAWPSLQSLVQEIPKPDGLADYCRAIEGFRKVRPSAIGDIKPHVTAMDELLWEKNLLGRVPQVCLDLFAKQYALEMVMLLTHIDQRLDEEKQKMSALDFDDLELRALELLARPEVVMRAAERYKFFLVDEFQDTNGLQRRLLERLALQGSRRESANLFIVGDRKQSIYGFRGADVDVFREMTESLNASGGEEKPLLLNYRSQPPLINFYNHLFRRLFQPKEEVLKQEREELGYVGHEPSEAKRELRDAGPLVEVMITTKESEPRAGATGWPPGSLPESLPGSLPGGVKPTQSLPLAVLTKSDVGKGDDPKAEQTSRELDAQQLAQRIIALTGNAVQYSDIALLFRAMTNVQTYESVFRRANIPYQTVLGRGFYEREEITDLVQLLRFLDNKTDELALAAVLRSPLGGISDNALLALRCAPWLVEVGKGDPLRHFTQTRKLFKALRQHREIAFINDDEHDLLDRAAALIKGLVARRHHYPIGSLLRFAVDQSEYMTVIAATFDGAQRLANVQRLFTLAERFERAGTHLIRDFVRYVEEFEAIGSRESEGQIDEATNAVRLMTIHQAKGLEFPIVIIPELQRYSRVPDSWVLLDRHRGLTLKVPDGRGKLVAGCTFNRFEQRNAWREQFESMRLLYVAATRAQDRLILSGTTKDLDKLGAKSDTWLNWIWQTLELPAPTASGTMDLKEQGSLQYAQFELMLNVADQQHASSQAQPDGSTEQPLGPPEALAEQPAEGPGSLSEAFPLLLPIEPERDRVVYRFSVTQLINYQRCPRQYYFDRVLHVPDADEMAVWNDAEAPEPPANLTATLKGAVIHRFCETYSLGEEVEARLRRSLDDVIRSRQAELADRLLDIDSEEALKELLPSAQNYLSSDVFQRIERARTAAGDVLTGVPAAGPGLWSELKFRLRRRLGILTGTIDKLLVSRSLMGDGFDIEIIDFKTNRIRNPSTRESAPTSSLKPQAGGVPGGAGPLGCLSRLPSGEADIAMDANSRMQARRLRSQHSAAQFAFDFSEPELAPKETTTTVEFAESASPSLADQIRLVASDYQLQMQAYALAVRELMPDLVRAGSEIKVTLHFLDPNVEFYLTEDLLEPSACVRAIDHAFLQLTSSREPEHFPVRPAPHCRRCNFLQICAGGREWIAESRLAR